MKAVEIVSFCSGNGKFISASVAYEGLHKRFRDTLLSFSSTVEVLKKKLADAQQKEMNQEELLQKYEEALELLKSEFT